MNYIGDMRLIVRQKLSAVLMDLAAFLMKSKVEEESCSMKQLWRNGDKTGFTTSYFKLESSFIWIDEHNCLPSFYGSDIPLLIQNLIRIF